MPTEKVTLFQCRDCAHRVEAYRMLYRTEFRDRRMSLGQNIRPYLLQPLIGRLKCSACGSKNIAILVGEMPKKYNTFVASAESETLVFHSPDCTWIKDITGRNVRTFKNRELAYSQGYKPCSFCNP